MLWQANQIINVNCAATRILSHSIYLGLARICTQLEDYHDLDISPSILVGGSLTLGKSFVSRFLQIFTPVHVNNGFFCGWCEDHQPQYL